MSNIKIIGNEKCWIEDMSIQQLKSVGNLKDVIRAVGLPDLHPGKGPVGIAVETKDTIYPHLIGNDIGCGMRLIKTGIVKRKFKKEKWVKTLESIENLREIPYINIYEEESPIVNLGTIGGGNHFAEFQCLEKVYDKEEFEKLEFNKEDIMLLIHCGSRGYGEDILREFLNYDGFDANSEKAKNYMIKHDNALLWARRNREVIGEKIMDYLGFLGERKTIIDCNHNFIEKRKDIYIHRKGAVSSEVGPVVIPGSRGSLTYIVCPTNDKEKSAFSLSHGAGRKWARNLCKSRLKDKYTRDTIKESKMKSSVVCHDSNLLYEEATEAYKNIDNIINCLIEYDLIKIIATMKPLITFKG